MVSFALLALLLAASPDLADVRTAPTTVTGQLATAGGCLTAGNATAASEVTVAPCRPGAPLQAWTVRLGGAAAPITLAGGLCLDAWGGTGAAGSRIGTYSCAPGAPNQTWALTATGALRGQNALCAVVGPGAPSPVTLAACAATPAATWRVAPYAAQTVALTLRARTLVPGDTTQASVQLATTTGVPLPDRPVTWRSSVDRVARLLPDGRIVALTPGTTTLSATVDGVTTTATLTVPGIAPDSIALAVRRLDGGTGSVLVSTGIPLRPGMLSAATLGTVHLTVAGREVPIAVTRLAGRHPDGSPRAILVQFDLAIPDTAPIPALLRIEPGRPATYRSAHPVPEPLVAVALPTSAAYLTATGLGGPLAPRWAAPGYDQFETDFRVGAEKTWASVGPRMERGIALYEHVLTTYQYWLRTAEPVWFVRAHQMVGPYRAFLAPSRGVTQPWFSNTEGLAIDYFLTGRDSVRLLIGALAETAAGMTRDAGNDWYRCGGTRGDDRMRGRALLALLDATLVEAPYGTYYTPDRLARCVRDVLGTQRPSGQFGGDDYQGGQKNFMAGLLLTGIIRYYDEVAPDPRIPPAIARATDFLWTQWVPARGGFRYTTQDTLPGDANAGVPVPGLNGLILPAFAWRYGRTHAPADQARADAILAGIRSQVGVWASYPMQFDQANYRAFNYLAYRAARP